MCWCLDLLKVILDDQGKKGDSRCFCPALMLDINTELCREDMDILYPTARCSESLSCKLRELQIAVLFLTACSSS